MSKTILVVDDGMLIALDIQSQLEEFGHTDISAPLTEFLRWHCIPFVLCSGTGFDEPAALFPATPILPKPFASDELLNALAPEIVH